MVVCLLPARSVSAETSLSRQINVVYDDSGSMYNTNGPVDTWCQAKYAMEVFAAMLGEQDTLNIYYMSDYEVDTSSGPRLVLYGKDGAAQNVSKLHSQTTVAGNTPFNSVRKAYADLAQTTADERWLVILTDGAFEDGALSKQEVDSFLGAKESDIQVMFLAMGPGAAGITSREDQHIYYEAAQSSKEILNQLTGICTRIFNSNRLDINASSKGFSFDVPMGELVVFAQGANVQINGIQGEDGKAYQTSTNPVEVKYSECDASNYNNTPTTDLLGSIATFTDDFTAGSYSVDVSGAETIEIFYKPNIEVAAYLTDASGQEVTDLSSLEAGDYTLNFGFVKAGTEEKVNQSELLGDVTYEAYVTNNGEQLDQVFGDGDQISLQEGDLSIDVIARYLDYNSVSTHLDYTIYRNKAVAFTTEKDPVFTLTSKGFNDDQIEVRMNVDGHELTQEEWDEVSVPTLQYEGADNKKNEVELVMEKSSDIGVFLVHPTLKSGKVGTGDHKSIPYTLQYQQLFGSETWSGSGEGTAQIEDTRNFFEKYWDRLVFSFIVLLILVLLLGYVPGIKHYLPKGLKKKPKIQSVDKKGKMEDAGNGKIIKNTMSLILPYVAQKATIKYLPVGVSGGSPVEVQAVKGKKMKIMNLDRFRGKNYIAFDGNEIEEEQKEYKNLRRGSEITFKEYESSGKQKVVKTYSCWLNQ